MVVAFLFLISLGLLFVDPNLTAFSWSTFPSFKWLYTLFLHQLDHGNFNHFIGNYLFMFPYAIYLESKIGRLKFLLFYFTVGCMAAGTQVLASFTGTESHMIGSSGAAFGVALAACMCFNDKLWKRCVSLGMIGVMLALQFQASKWQLFSNVAYFAHIGGGIAGIVLIYFMNPFVKKEKPSRPSPRSRSRR